jgi:glyoxylase-like metal-dependent hydrolase (beta-lactamase superfamily II)
MNTLSLRVFLLIPVLVSVVFAQKFESKHFKIEKLSDGVFVAIHSFGGYAICNSGIVEIGNKVLVFDTFLTPEAAKDLKKAVESLTGKSVTYVINSHAHNDHIRGNQVFHPNSVIISTNNIRKQIEKDEPKKIAYEKENVAERLSQMKRNYETAEDDATKMEYYMWIGYYEGMMKSHPEIKTSIPEVTFEDSLTFYGSDRIGILYAYSTGHTDEDIILYLPEEKILFTGDLVFNGMHPYLPHGDPDKLKTILKSLFDLQIEKVIPGHGEVCGSKGIRKMIDYIDMIERLAHDFKKSGGFMDDYQISNLPMPYQSWNFPRFFSMNLKFMYERIE